MSLSPTLYERALAKVSPSAALSRISDRARFSAISTAAEAADRSIMALAGEGPADAPEGPYATTGGGLMGWFKRWSAGLRDAAGDTLPHLRELRAQSSDLMRKEAYARSALYTKANRAVGTGLALSAQPNLRVLGWSKEKTHEWRQLVQSEFSLFADSPECDWLGQSNFYDQQWLALLSTLERGDAFTVLPDAEPTPTMPYALRLQLIEADRCGNPLNAPDSVDVAGGVKRGRGGKPPAFFIYDRHPGAIVMGAPSLYSGQWIESVGESGRRRILHHVLMARPEQPRGVPDLAPVMALFKNLGRYTDAEIKAAIVSGFLTVLIETEGGNPAPVFGLQNPDPNNPAAAQVPPQPLELGPAAVLGLAKGEKPTLVDPTRPNPIFGVFVQAVVDQLGAGTLLGPEMLAKKYATSYVAARAAFLDAWTHIRMLRRKVVTTLCQPVYETWMAEAVIRRRIPAPGFFRDPLLRWAYTRAMWTGDSQGSINPKDEVAAFVSARDNRLITNERAAWELFGFDWNEVYPTMLAEHEQLKADGMLPVPKAGAAAPADDKGDGKDDEPKKGGDA